MPIVNKQGAARPPAMGAALTNDNPIIGIAWVSLSMLLLVCLTTVARYALLAGVHPLQATCLIRILPAKGLMKNGALT